MSSKLEFNKNLSRYLSARKRWRPSYNSLYFRLSKPRLRSEDGSAFNAEDLTIRRRFAAWYDRQFAKKQTEYLGLPVLGETETVDLNEAPVSVHVETISDEQTVVKESFFARLRAKFSRQEVPQVSAEEIDNIYVEDMKSDLKKVANRFVGIVEKLGHRHREQLKNTQEFNEIKEIFRKHNIIK